MAVLFLHPLALGLLLGLLVYAWLVWRGMFRHWFGRGGAWTVLAWPVPLLAIGVPPLAGGLLWLAGYLGVEIGDGDVTDALLYAAVYLVPAAVLAVWPPRWLLPVWARRRLSRLPRELDPSQPEGAMPAVQADRGHGSRARWVWLVDGLAGHVWVEGSTLRFRPATTSTSELATHLDLGEFDRVGFRGVVPWRRAGLVSVELTDRRPVQLWVADIRQLEQALAGGGDEPEADPDLGEDRPGSIRG